MTQPIEMFGQFVILKRLAAGGMAEIFLARPASAEANGRVLVIKRILPHIASDPSFHEMFQSEIQICMGLNHPNIVQIHDFGAVNGTPYIAMEYVNGKTVKDLMLKAQEADRQLPIEMAASIVAQAAAGLHYAHSFENSVTGSRMNVIHRDISPHNLLLSYDGNVKIIDFGIAKSETKLADHTRTGTIKGKVCYLSPDQIEMCDLDGRSDVFSLGIVLWELLTGVRLFSQASDTEMMVVLSRIHNCDQFIRPPSEVCPRVPSALDEITLRALAKKREDRYETAAEFQKALRGFLLASAPNYSYSDVGRTLKEMFQTETIEERKQLRELNELAQNNLSKRPRFLPAGRGPTPEVSQRTVSVVPPPPPIASSIRAIGTVNGRPINTTSIGGNKSASVRTRTNTNDIGVPSVRQSNELSSNSIELLLSKYGNRRTSWPIVAIVIIYVVVMLGFKFDERYEIVNRFLTAKNNSKHMVKHFSQTENPAPEPKNTRNSSR